MRAIPCRSALIGRRDRVALQRASLAQLLLQAVHGVTQGLGVEALQAGSQHLHAGDLDGPVRRGTFAASDVRATLADLVTRRHPGRASATEVTLFKSVGSALQDLVAAALVVESSD